MRFFHSRQSSHSQKGNALLIIMVIASVSGLLIWSMAQTIENRQKERRLESGKTVRNEIWRSISTYASDASTLRTVGQKIASGQITGASNRNFARCLGYLTDDRCRQTSSSTSNGPFDSNTNEFRTANEITIAEESPPGSGTLVYHTRIGSNPVYYSLKGERDCSRGDSCLLVARTGFFARCSGGASSCTTAETVTVIVQVKHVGANMTAADIERQQNLDFSAFPSNSALKGTFANGWDKFARQLAVTDIRGDWGCPIGSYPQGIRQTAGAVAKSNGIPNCKCFWETYPTLSPDEKTIVRRTLRTNSDNQPIDCETKLDTWMNRQSPLICPASRPVFVGYKFVINSGTGLQEPVIECTTFTMTNTPVDVGTSQRANCAQQTGATAESRVCGLDVSTCTMDAAKNIQCGDAKISCCTPR